MYLIIGIIILACLVLWAIILVQNPKGGGLSSQFGGGSVTNLIGAKKSVDFIEKATWTVGAVVLGLVLLSNIAIPTNGGNSNSDAPKVADPAQNTVVPTQPAADQGLPIDGSEFGDEE
ncbi:MAG: preprotein translocase subunit SecG [Bacteroidetes bacterium]|nr:preprotein translocase subunit SecG [Bacteroidota bacterium]